MPLVFIAGTRPEINKIVPVMVALQAQGLHPLLLLTGQHTSLLDGTPLHAITHVTPLDLPSDGNIPRWLQQAEAVLDRSLQVIRDACEEVVVVVQGDTMSALAGAEAAERAGIPIAHIEAGVRSHDLMEPWPEEGFRVRITQLAQWHYAPTRQAFAHLVLEGIPATKILVTGNTGISALHTSGVTPIREPHPQIVVTLHRRELTRDRERLQAVMVALLDAFGRHPEVQVIWPLHPSIAKIPLPEMPLPVRAHVQWVAPMAAVPFLRLVAGSMGVLTDSGGLVEEAAHLGVPTAILRAQNDRPEAVTAGIARCFDPSPEGATAAVQCLMDQTIPRRPHTCYGFPDAAQHIAQHLQSLASPILRT